MATQNSTKKSTTKKKTVKKKAAPATKKKVTAKKRAAAPKAAAASTAKVPPAQEKVLSGLMKSLQSVFDKIHSDNQVRDDHHDKVIEDFSQRLNKAFLQTHSAAEEREKLLEEKLEAIEREQSYRIQRIKLFSLPGTVIAVAALIYLFYVVHVMERSMTSMSADMHEIRGHIADIGVDTKHMSGGVVSMNEQMTQMNTNMDKINTNVGGMNGNMTHLNRNVGVMTHDVGNMSNTVSPVMNNMRKIMPMF
jgi:methyl-accepting chemotaxis protein